MPAFIHGTIYIIGWAVCIVGGLGLLAALALWAVDRILKLSGTTMIVARWWLAKKFPDRFRG